MKNKPLILTLVAALAALFLFSSCAAGPGSTAKVSAFASPAKVQADLTVLSSGLSVQLTPRQRVDAMILAHALAEVNIDNADVATLQMLVPNANPVKGSFAIGLIDQGVSVVNLALAHFGEHNPVAVSYFKAVGNGILNGLSE